ncbi:hypothetical protein ABZX92_36460 [Lentzea sp. NPDC006480]|uniref:hypothetical protein n=1 Tax=Lentzea sp. NPDC006480 TaxID=3157176 RepID=UPI00339EFA54
MSRWFRYFFADDDVWLHYEVDDEGRVCRQVDLAGADLSPVTAASLAEVLHARDSGGVETVIAYESRFGAMAEGQHEWQGVPGLENITAAEFERIWAAAREVLEER